MIILYKNSSRTGVFVDCPVSYSANEFLDSVPLSEKISSCSENDLIIPFGIKSESLVIECRIRVILCDDKGNLNAIVSKEMSPDLFSFRTDRGPINVFNENARFLMTNEDFTIQIATKDKPSAIRGILRIEFIRGTQIIAKSDTLLILSKPPAESKTFPFARSPANSSSRVPLSPSPSLKPWKFAVLGEYRRKNCQEIVTTSSIELKEVEKKTEILKKKRSRDDQDTEDLRSQLAIALCRIAAAEKEQEGLKRALRLLSENN